MKVYTAVNKWLTKKLDGSFPYYDSTTKTIHNCEKNTYTYFHEMRHMKQDLNTPFMRLANFLHGYGYYLAIGLAIIVIIEGRYDFILPTIGLMMSPYIIVVSLLELDAYVFGTVDYLKFKNKNKK